MRKLVLVHGRSQQRKDPHVLKREWLGALHAGFAAAGVSLDVPDERVVFPYYGDTLDQLARQPSGAAPDVVVAGIGDPDAAEKVFIGNVVAEIAQQQGIGEDEIRAETGAVEIEMGPLNWFWVLAALRVLDKVPGVGAATISLATHDVWMYLKNLGIQRIIDDGVRKAITPGEETVVVSHSLGTVVAYSLLAREAHAAGWEVPTLVTVGCPLGMRAIVTLLRPITHPDGVGDWFNAYDPDDTVALNPLDAAHFPITPAPENYGAVDNPTSNQHGISGYLDDPTVARHIYKALLD